jgi:hypothetical protein
MGERVTTAPTCSKRGRFLFEELVPRKLGELEATRAQGELFAARRPRSCADFCARRASLRRSSKCPARVGAPAGA